MTLTFIRSLLYGALLISVAACNDRKHWMNTRLLPGSGQFQQNNSSNSGRYDATRIQSAVREWRPIRVLATYQPGHDFFLCVRSDPITEGGYGQDFYVLYRDNFLAGYSSHRTAPIDRPLAWYPPIAYTLDHATEIVDEGVGLSPNRFMIESSRPRHRRTTSCGPGTQQPEPLLLSCHGSIKRPSRRRYVSPPSGMHNSMDDCPHLE